ILNLLSALQRDLGVAYLFITHNIGVVEYLAHRVAVMYLGRIVEEGPAPDVLTRPHHPYTQALLQAVPRLTSAPRAEASSEATGSNESSFVRGETPSALAPPSGCHFHPRCPYADGECAATYPAKVAVPGGVPGHHAACMKLDALAQLR
ncbi:MAG: ABC transporter ATP-binding protein, partial [Burkholderiales bacterium]